MASYSKAVLSSGFRYLSHKAKYFDQALAEFCQGSDVPKAISDTVTSILADVRKHGDKAVFKYAKKFDGAVLTQKSIRVPLSELKAASKKLSKEDMRALKAAHASILSFNKNGLPKDWILKNKDGAWAGEKFDPLNRVGLYIPGGEVPLVSTVLMTAVLAHIAGCPEIVAFTPAKKGGEIAPGILAALHLAGVSEVYRFGGVQAVAAMAYGTESIRPVDKIFGPGNAYVCEAKRQVFGTVGVDSLPGPSEVMVIADEKAPSAWVAADLLAQAEHGSGREKIFLVSTSLDVLGKVAFEVMEQVSKLTRSEKVLRVLNDGFICIHVANEAEAAAVANYVAPEHLELMVKPDSAIYLTGAITTAGAIMLGNDTPTVLGDFVGGPSHVLPTARAGRYFGGLRVTDFLRRTSLLKYDQKSLRRAAPTVAAFARMEKLDAHGNSALIRLK